MTHIYNNSRLLVHLGTNFHEPSHHLLFPVHNCIFLKGNLDFSWASILYHTVTAYREVSGFCKGSLTLKTPPLTGISAQ